MPSFVTQPSQTAKRNLSTLKTGTSGATPTTSGASKLAAPTTGAPPPAVPPSAAATQQKSTGALASIPQAGAGAGAAGSLSKAVAGGLTPSAPMQTAGPVGGTTAGDTVPKTQEAMLPAGMVPSAGSGAGVEGGAQSEIDKLYDDIMKKHEESWGNIQDMYAAQNAGMQRRAMAMQGAMGRSVAGGFAGAMSQAFLTGQQNLMGAQAQHEQTTKDLMLKNLDRKLQQQRYEEETGRSERWREEDFQERQSQQEADAVQRLVDSGEYTYDEALAKVRGEEGTGAGGSAGAQETYLDIPGYTMDGNSVTNENFDSELPRAAVDKLFNDIQNGDSDYAQWLFDQGYMQGSNRSAIMKAMFTLADAQGGQMPTLEDIALYLGADKQDWWNPGDWG